MKIDTIFPQGSEHYAAGLGLAECKSGSDRKKNGKKDFHSDRLGISILSNFIQI